MNEWNKIPSDEVINSTAEAIRARGMEVIIVNTKEEALEKIKEIIPDKAEVMTGSSMTLNAIGFTDYLQSTEHPYKNINAEVWAENDDAKRNKLRRIANTADYFLSSINAISAEGELVAVDATGSRVSALPFSAGQIIFVAGVNKIAPNLEAAMKRVKEHVFPLENERAKIAYGGPTTFGKWVIIEREVNKERIRLILIKEELGY